MCVCVFLCSFLQLFFMIYGLCFFELTHIFFFILRTTLLHLISIITKAVLLIIGHCLGLAHETMLRLYVLLSLIARFMGPTWGPPGADGTQVGPMLAPWTLLSGMFVGRVLNTNVTWNVFKLLEKRVTWRLNLFRYSAQYFHSKLVWWFW